MSRFQDPPSFTLEAGDKLVIERGGARPPVHGQANPQSGSYQVRLIRDGQDMGLLTQKDENGQEIRDERGAAKSIELNMENPELTLQGSGKGVLIDISRAAGMNSGDFVPRFGIRTDEPVVITGGSYVTADDSTQKARTPISPMALTSVSVTKEKDGNGFNVIAADDTMRESEEKEKQYTAHTILLKLQGGHTVGAEQGSPGTEFFNPRDKNAELFTLDGQQSLAANQERFAPIVDSTRQTVVEKMADKKLSAAEKSRLGIPGSIPTEKVPNLSQSERNEIRSEGGKVAQLLGDAGRRKESNGKRLDENPELKPYFDEANLMAASFSQKGTASPERLQRFDAAIDKLMELSEDNRSLNRRDLQKIKDTLDTTRELAEPKEKEKSKKTGKAEDGGLSHDLLAAARDAVDPMINQDQRPESRIDGSPDSPSPLSNPLSPNTVRTV